MAWGTPAGTAASGIGSAVTRSVTNGNLLVVYYHCDNNSSTPTISDTGSVTAWTACTNSPLVGASNILAAWWKIVDFASGSITITVANTSSSGFEGIAVIEVSGNASSTPNDGGCASADVAGATGTDAMKAASAFTPGTSGDMIYSFIIDVQSDEAVQEYTAGTNFTLVTGGTLDPGGLNKITMSSEYFVQSSAASINPPWTEALLARTSHILSVAFKVAGAAAATPRFLSLLGAGA